MHGAYRSRVRRTSRPPLPLALKQRAKLAELQSCGAPQAPQQTSGENVEARIRRIETGLEALRIEYEKYFFAARPTEPCSERSLLQRGIADCKATQTVNTALRFRLQSIVARFQSHDRLWNDTQRRLESGRPMRPFPKAKPSVKT